MATVALALVLVVEIPLAGRDPAPVGANPNDVSVTFRTDATPAEISANGAQLLETYAAFAIAHGSTTTMVSLRSRGRYAEPLADASQLDLASGPVDIAALASRPTKSWSTDDRGTAVGVVHFGLPIKPEWKAALEARGITVLEYLPQDAFIVRGRPSDLQAAFAAPGVDWVGPYDSGWKFRPHTILGPRADVRIVVFPGSDPEAIEAWLGHAGIPTVGDGISGLGIVGAFGSGDFQWVRARIPTNLIGPLANEPSVEFIDPVEPVHPLNAETDWVIQTNTSNLDRYWTNGLDARGQVIGMADTGLDYDGSSFRHNATTITLGDIYNVTDMSRRKVVRYVDMGVLTGQLTWPGGGGVWDPYSIKDCDHGHGTAVASTLAGNDNGIGTSPDDGNALMGKIYLQDIGGFQGIAVCPSFGGEDLIYLPEDYTNLFGPPGLVYNDPIAPVRIHSDSWGAATDVYDVQARMVDAFVWSHPDMTILFAAGNCPTACASGSVGTPATAKDIVSVGGAYNPDDTGSGFAQNDLATQSGRGPTPDGRIKPDVVTIFDGDSAMSDGDPMDGRNASEFHWAGTSYATPAAAAAAAIIRQYFVDGWYPSGSPIGADSMAPSAALVRAMLIAAGQQVTGSGTVRRSSTDTWPNNEQGFGRVLLSKVLPIAAAGDTFRTEVVDGTAGLLTGDDAAYTFHVATVGPVKFVLAWSDYPGTIGAAKALVNDLDLEVTAPNGTVYRGNHFAPFAQGQSLPDGAFDTTNVEEAVILKNAAIGDWTVRVIGSNVPVGPQRFALVATGSLDGSYGRVVLDRPAYSEADTVRIAVEDSDATSVVVHVASGLEPVGEDVTLSQPAPGAVWRGAIATAFATPTADGVLEVRDGDTVTATYLDTSPPHTATARAKILARGPTIHDVNVIDIGATDATVRWTTGDPATSEVRFGLNFTSLSRDANTSDLRIAHAITLTDLAPGTRYAFEVISRGRLRNATTDSNAGRGYEFETASLGDVLLVVGGQSFPAEREASYLAALAESGWTASVWRVAELGLPPLAVLQGRRAVIWQVGLEQYPTFNASARDLVQRYLDQGGRLIVSSHDTSWALGDSASPFWTAETAAWLRGVLKASFVCDPSTIAQVKGVSSDPISGPYTGGVGYTPHREGGADDQITPNAAGGTAATMWTDAQVVSPLPPATQCSQGQPVGIRWVSGSPNGTAGTGVWGGTPSRLAYFAFEITGIDTTATSLNPTSTTRAAILDSALRWLVSTSTNGLDRDHPDVNITFPNGGTFTGASIPVTWTATAYGTAVGIANFSLTSSRDGGLTWLPVATLPGSARSYTWNIGAVPNGVTYLLRLATQDTGTPSLDGADVTDGTFTIARPGGDTEGPVLWAGSVRVDPDPPGAALLATFNGTADDRARGGGAIVAAELFLQTASPAPADSGTGLPMTAADGSFDGPVEDVTWQGGLAAPPGIMCVWVHAEDAAGNWGPYDSRCFYVIFAGPDTVPAAPAPLRGLRSVNANQDLEVDWNAPWDQGRYGGTTTYRVLRATAPIGPYADVSGVIPANASARYGFIDPGRAADPVEYSYRIETADAANNTALSTMLAVKARIPIGAGLNLLGMPIELTDPVVGHLVAGITWADAWTYDACAVGFAWSSAVPSDATTFAIPAGRAFWLNGTAIETITALGLLAETPRVRLCAGWNLVALPGFASGLTVANVKAATGADVIMGFDPAGPYHVQSLSDADPILTGVGYWVHVAADVTWTVAGW